MKKTVLRNYARLIAKMGINLQKGQNVIITASLDQPEFVTMLVEECYKLGANRVKVEWDYLPLTKVHMKKGKVRMLSHIEEWEKVRLQHYVDTLPARIYLESDDPDGLKGVNQKKMATVGKNRFPIIKPYRDAMENKYQWCIAAVPGAVWAKKLFPDLRKSQAIEKLWEAILKTARADGEDPIAAWVAHNKDLRERYTYLNGLGIEALEYKSANGTDLRVGMIPDALFMGGAEAALGSGIIYNPNIPSEEVFTSPKRGEAEGIVYASKPLSYRGEIIDKFWVRFEKGKVVDCHAEVGEPLLREMIGMDDGAAYLGECALVPYSSPIRESGILFYNTLFDENAACHLALGMGFANVIKDYEKYTLDECREKGINDSMIHVDFMIGTKDLSIVAVTRDGKRVQIFKDGEWAF